MQMFDDPDKPVAKASKRAKLEKPVGTTPATPEVSGQLWLHVLHEWVPTFSANVSSPMQLKVAALISTGSVLCVVLTSDQSTFCACTCCDVSISSRFLVSPCTLSRMLHRRQQWLKSWSQTHLPAYGHMARKAGQYCKKTSTLKQTMQLISNLVRLDMGT